MTARYLLCPGRVTSRTDGDHHHVTANQLAMLYGVKMSECLVIPPQSPANHRERMALLDRVRLGELVGLAPRYDGDYQRPQNYRRDATLTP